MDNGDVSTSMTPWVSANLVEAPLGRARTRDPQSHRSRAKPTFSIALRHMRNAAGEIRRVTKRAEAAALNRWRATNASSANLNRGTSKATTPAGWISAKLKRVRDNQRNGRHVSWYASSRDASASMTERSLCRTQPVRSKASAPAGWPSVARSARR